MKLKTKTEIAKMSEYLRQNYSRLVLDSKGAITGAYISKKVQRGKSKKRYALVFQVQKKIKKPEFMIPKWITIDILPSKRRKFPTDVVEAGNFNLLSYRLGSRVNNINTGTDNWGGVGILVRRDNIDYLCTCMHVLKPLLIDKSQFSFRTAFSGQPPDVEVWEDGVPKKQVAFCEEGYFGDEVDAAIARIIEPNTLENLLPIYGKPNGFKVMRESHKGFELTMMGAKSNIQHGELLQVSVAKTVKNKNFYELIKTDIISQEGDSGSPVFGKKNQEIVGIVFGKDDNNATYLIPIYAILNKFGVSLL